MNLNNTIEKFLVLKFPELDSCVAFIENDNWGKLVELGLADFEPCRMGNYYFTNFVLTAKGKELRDKLIQNKQEGV